MTLTARKFVLDFLDAVIRLPDLMTTDDCTSDLKQMHRDGGKWKGPIVRSIAADGLIRPVGAVLSRRTARKRGLLHSWAATDIEAVKRRRDAIAAGIQALETERPATQLTLPGID